MHFLVQNAKNYIYKYMLLVNRGANNTLIMTLTEKSSLTSPYYLMKLQNDATRQVKTVVLASDLSSYTYRYNQFLLTESATEVLTSGTVELKPTGYWSYWVYEQASSTNLSIDAATGLVESGKLKVIGTDTTYTEYQPHVSYKAYGTGT